MGSDRGGTRRDGHAGAPLSIGQDNRDVREIEMAMFYALEGTVAQMVAGERVPDDLPSVVIVACLANMGRILGALFSSEERDTMYAFIVDDGMLVIDGAMRTTMASMQAQAERLQHDDDE